MLKINKKVEYALIVLKLMLEKANACQSSNSGEKASESALTTAREISDKFSTPFDTTAKVMQLMNNANILASVKGVKGGYHLSQDLSELSYMSLAEIIEGKSLSMDCEAMKCQLLGTCNITGPVSRLNGYIDTFLRDLSVRELLSEKVPLEINKENAPATRQGITNEF